MERVLCPVLIGREPELSSLEDALLAANRGQGQVVLLAGDAGMGKTRLATELSRRAHQLGMTVLLGGCSEAELALPYLPFLEAIGNYLADTDLAAVRERLGPVRRELGQLFPQVDPEGSSPDTDTVQGKLRLFEAILALLAIPAATTGLLVVVEDLHWADASTRELLDYLTRRLRTARILVLGTYRRDEMHRKHPLLPMVQGWRRSASAGIVDLDPLSPDAVARMVRAIFDIEEVRDDTRDFLHQRSEGNPFVLEEMLKVAVDSGDIYRDGTGWTRKSLAEIRLPVSVRDTILVRVERLGERQLEVLRAASVLGNVFPYPALVGLSGGDEATVTEAVATCVQQQILEDDPRGGGRYRFHHALTREAIYEDMIVPVRERLHSRAADILIAAGAPPIDQAHHLLAARRTAEAVPACLQAGEVALAQHAYQDAAALLLMALPHVEAGRPEVLCSLGEALLLGGEPNQARKYLTEGLTGMEAGAARSPHYRLVLGRSIWETGSSELALAEYERACQELETIGPSEDLAMAHIRLSGMRLFQFDTEGCVFHAREAIRIAEAVGADTQRFWGTAFLGSGLAQQGRFEEGIALVDQSVDLALARGFYHVAANGLFNGIVIRIPALRIQEVAGRLALLAQFPATNDGALFSGIAEGFAAQVEGRMAGSLEIIERTLAMAREAGAETWVKRLNIWSVSCLVELDRLSEADHRMPALADFAEAQERLIIGQSLMRLAIVKGRPEAGLVAARIAFSDDLGAIQRQSYAASSVELFLAAGDVESARRAGEVVRTDPTSPLGAARRPGALARLALVDGEVVAAIAPLREAVELLSERDYGHQASRDQQVLADLLAATGDIEGAVAELGAIVARASRLGMPLEARLAREHLARLGATAQPAAAAAAGRERADPVTGERLVTVLFADVRGYTALSRISVPAEMADRIGTFQRWATDEVGRHRGLVDKFAGDALMATFNVSGASVDHARHALECAIALRDKAAMLGLPLGIGIATGPAVVGALAPGANISVVGEATNLASRLQGQAEAGEIVISVEAQRRLRDWLGRQSMVVTEGTVALKGFEEPVPAFRLR